MITDDMHVSPKYTVADFQSGSIDAIGILEDQIHGWLFDPADALRLVSVNATAGAERHNGIAILALELLFFEPHGQYLQGAKSGASSKTFKVGFDAFIRYLLKHDPSQASEFGRHKLHSKHVYGLARCGLFHSALVKRGLLVQPDLKGSIAFRYDTTMGAWVVNPWPLLTSLRLYFDSYTASLRASNPKAQRDSFDKMATALLGTTSGAASIAPGTKPLLATAPISGSIAP
jgi:hypothetical protein